MSTTTAIERTSSYNEHEEFEETNIDADDIPMKNRFDQILTGSSRSTLSSGYQSISIKVPAFTVFRTMFAIYVFCIWDCITDILVIISLSRNCKQNTFQESKHIHTYYILLTLSYISTIAGILNVLRQYFRVIYMYTISKNKNKSIWNDGFKYVTVRYIQQTDFAEHCNTEKKLRTLFAVLEDYVQFAVTTILLIFFKDGNVLILLSWSTSLLVIGWQFSIDLYSIYRGTCIKCIKLTKLYKCNLFSRWKEWCYDTNSTFMKILRYAMIGAFLFMILVCIPLFILGQYDLTNRVIGGIVHYNFRGEIHWVESDQIVFYNISGRFHTNPFENWAWIDFYGKHDDTRRRWDNLSYIGITFECASTGITGSCGRISFQESDESGIEYLYNGICNNVNTFGAMNCLISSTSEKLDVWSLNNNDKTAIDSNSTWFLQYDFIYYNDSC
eukprot:349323_1